MYHSSVWCWSWGRLCMWGGRGISEISVSSSQCYCIPTTSFVKNKAFLKTAGEWTPNWEPLVTAEDRKRTNPPLCHCLGYNELRHWVPWQQGRRNSLQVQWLSKLWSNELIQLWNVHVQWLVEGEERKAHGYISEGVCASSVLCTGTSSPPSRQPRMALSVPKPRDLLWPMKCKQRPLRACAHFSFLSLSPSNSSIWTMWGPRWSAPLDCMSEDVVISIWFSTW